MNAVMYCEYSFTSIHVYSEHNKCIAYMSSPHVPEDWQVYIYCKGSICKGLIEFLLLLCRSATYPALNCFQ